MIEYWKNLDLRDLFYVNDDGLVCCEEWRDIKDYEGYYQVSNLGRVKSLDRIAQCRWGDTRYKSRVLRQNPNPDSYLEVKLCKKPTQIPVRVHRLVAQAFIPNPENKPEVNHMGEKPNKQDNRAWILEWNTRLENQNHAIENNLVDNPFGERHGMSKLKEFEVIEIFENKHKLKRRELAEKYEVCEGTIKAIRNGRLWKHLDLLNNKKTAS